MPKFAGRHGIWVCAVILVWAPRALAGESETSNWPCIQHKVPEISAGMMWAGPEIDEQDRTWQESPTIAPLAYRLAQRRLPIEEAVNEIDAFANELSEDANRQLVTLFTALLQIINAERSDIMAGIERYARQQARLAEDIKAVNREIADVRAAAVQNEGQQRRLEELEQQLAWETRIFSEREESLAYVCESPVLLEQRLFALARQIMANLD